MASEQTYTFISDPTHNETLSGRVSAACAECRLRKVKCSGYPNCKQCGEKAVSCEAPPARKRAKYDSASNRQPLNAKKPHNDETLADIDTAHADLLPASPSKFPGHAYDNSVQATSQDLSRSPLPHKPSGSGQVDSGLLDWQTQQRPGPSAQENLGLTMHSGLSTLDNRAPDPSQNENAFYTDISPTTTASSGWSPTVIGRGLERQWSSSHAGPKAQTAPQSQQPPQIMQPPPRPDVGQSIADHGSDQQYDSTAHDSLIQAAEVLESKARSLRQLAQQRGSAETARHAAEKEAASRARDQTYAWLDLGASDGASRQSSVSAIPSSFLRSDGSMRSGLTPSGPTAEAPGYIAAWNMAPEQVKPPIVGVRDTSMPGVHDLDHSEDNRRSRLQQAFQSQMDKPEG